MIRTLAIIAAHAVAAPLRAGSRAMRQLHHRARLRTGHAPQSNQQRDRRAEKHDGQLQLRGVEQPHVDDDALGLA